MKKVLIALGVVAVLIGGGLVLLLSNLDGLVKTAIETYGSEAVGSQVSVGSVELNLTEGSAAIYDFSVANPPGFSDQPMMSFSEVTVAIDLATIGEEVIGIKSIIARSPYVLYESANDTTNIDTVSARFAGDGKATDTSDNGEESEVELRIASILIENIQAQMEGDDIPDLNINLGDISLQNLAGTPDEIAAQIMGPVTRQISANAASALLEATAAMITQGLEGATENLSNIGELGEGLSEGIDDVGNAVEEGLQGLGNLFGN
ncbi:MAG: hypothetical protein ACO4AC_05660 [Pseudohongiellaceae bacterium]